MAKDTGAARGPTRKRGGYTGSTDAADVLPPSKPAIQPEPDDDALSCGECYDIAHDEMDERETCELHQDDAETPETYAHDPDCNTDHEAGADPCPPPRDAEAPDMAARPFDELRGSGLLWLINRVVFHPRGFALALHVEGGEVVGWSLQGDGAEVWQFADPEDESFVSAEATLRAARAPHA